MPKRAVRILVSAVLMGFLGAAGSAQQRHESGKTQSAPPPPPAPARATTTTAATTAKFTPVTRDVCDKHPNLKQCS